jgi:hypothetical protein
VYWIVVQASLGIGRAERGMSGNTAVSVRPERVQRGTKWCRLDCGRQALLVLAYLRNGDTYARLAAGFGVGTSAAWRYVRQGVDLLAVLADELSTAVSRAARLVYAILDGTLIPIDRVVDQKPYYSGKHRRHGVNVQILADPAGRLVWVSPALPGATHDLVAARAHGLIGTLALSNVLTLADEGYQGAGGTVVTPLKRHSRRARLSRNEKAVKTAIRLCERVGVAGRGGWSRRRLPRAADADALSRTAGYPPLRRH